MEPAPATALVLALGLLVSAAGLYLAFLGHRRIGGFERYGRHHPGAAGPLLAWRRPRRH